MSVVIAAKYRDGVALIADKQATTANNKVNNVKKLQRFILSNTGIGTVGYLRDCNVMRVLEEILEPQDIINKVDIDDIYVIREIVPKIYEHMKEHKRILHSELEVPSMPSQMLFVTSSRIFEIDPDFSVVEAEKCYSTIGCGEEKVRGYMSLIGDTSDKTQREIEGILVEAIRRGCEDDVYINNAYDIMFFEED